MAKGDIYRAKLKSGPEGPGQWYNSLAEVKAANPILTDTEVKRFSVDESSGKVIDPTKPEEDENEDEDGGEGEGEPKAE